MPSLKINGRLTQFADDDLPASVAGLLQHLNLDSAAVVAEIDGQIVERANFATTSLKAGQAIELVRFVPGG